MWFLLSVSSDSLNSKARNSESASITIDPHVDMCNQLTCLQRRRKHLWPVPGHGGDEKGNFYEGYK